MPPEAEKPLRKKWQLVAVGLFLVLLGVVLIFAYFTSAPRSFPTDQSFDITSGSSASAIADAAQTAHVVRSGTILYMVLVFLHDPSDIKAGAYAFSEPMNVFEVANRLSHDVPQAELVSLTFPEGYSVREYALLASEELPDFDAEYFYEQARGYEGFLFPDTYFVPESYTADELIVLLREAYQQKTATLRTELTTHYLTEEGLITLASIVEREANSPESMRMVAGILLSRMNLGMPLQVDASMEYVLEKPLKELTPEDLKIDSPYNTYLYKGLPPTPIGNPGLTAIEAVLFPEPSPYLFYITGTDGNFYYAETLHEHNANIARYLK